MATIIEIDGVRATLKADGTWRSSEEIIEQWLNTVITEDRLEGYVPDVASALVQMAVKELDAIIISHDQPKFNPLVVY